MIVYIFKEKRVGRLTAEKKFNLAAAEGNKRKQGKMCMQYSPVRAPRGVKRHLEGDKLGALCDASYKSRWHDPVRQRREDASFRHIWKNKK